ncbi:MAG: ADP-ribosylglycohydrolase family protein, partial [Bacillota bacterium]
MTLYLSEEKYRDKVYGCWLGKNAGGTLGEPLEKRFGQEEMFNVDWYPELPEEGLPNDDLEIQLIWLQALQEKGPGLTARDLVEYWLDCICYNFDEYGLHKTNLKKGLMPP